MAANIRVHCPFEMPSLTPPSSWPSTVVLSIDPAVLVGQGLGEYKLEDSYNGRPLYILRDTVNKKTIYVFFFNDGENHGWHVGDLLGTQQAWFYNPSNSTQVPANSWRASNGTSLVEEPSVTVQMDSSLELEYSILLCCEVK